MLKKTVNYEDFDGNQRTEDLYFNLTKLEATEFALDLPDEITDEVVKEYKNIIIIKSVLSVESKCTCYIYFLNFI